MTDWRRESAARRGVRPQLMPLANSHLLPRRNGQAPHARHDKEHAFAEAAFGMLGLETALAVVLETMVLPGRLGWREVAERMSVVPAHIARLGIQGRPLAVGEPANLTLVDPTARAVVDRAASASLSRNNPWHGRDLPDPVVATFWEGRATYRRD